jgi:hypothetical protein
MTIDMHTYQWLLDEWFKRDVDCGEYGLRETPGKRGLRLLVCARVCILMCACMYLLRVYLRTHSHTHVNIS